jgi:hypothetical protein
MVSGGRGDCVGREESEEATMAQAKAKAAAAPTAGSSTTAKKSTPAKKSAHTKKGTTAKKSAPAKKGAAAATKGMVDSTAELSDDVLKAVEAGQRAAIDALHRFLETVDEVLPALGERPSRREKVVDAALEMADRLTTTQYEFLRAVVRSADKSLGQSEPDTK